MNRSLAKLQRVDRSYEKIQSKYRVLKTLPFNSDAKKMSVVVELEQDKMVRIYTKGASESLIDDCAAIIDKNNQLVDLDLNRRDKIKNNVISA